MELWVVFDGDGRHGSYELLHRLSLEHELLAHWRRQLLDLDLKVRIIIGRQLLLFVIKFMWHNFVNL